MVHRCTCMVLSVLSLLYVGVHSTEEAQLGGNSGLLAYCLQLPACVCVCGAFHTVVDLLVIRLLP